MTNQLVRPKPPNCNWPPAKAPTYHHLPITTTNTVLKTTIFSNKRTDILL